MNDVLKKRFKALANPARIEILALLSSVDNGGIQNNGGKQGEVSVFQIVEKIPLSPSTISHHLSVLKEADVVNSRKDKQWIYYSLNRNTIDTIKDFLGKL